MGSQATAFEETGTLNPSSRYPSTYRIVCYVCCILFISSFCLFSTSSRNPSIVLASSNATIGGCPLFPSDNIWNQDISSLPIHPNSANFISSIGLTGHLQADFGSGLYNGAPIGIPYTIVPGSQPYVPVSFDYAGESDPGPYPIPSNVPIEGGPQSSDDRHVIVVNSGTCKLYEMYAAYPQSNGSWKAGSGAAWNLTSDALRPATWTSSDAAGLPILPGLVRYDEVASGVINHALRFTVNSTQSAFLWPARHFASSSANPNLPPMGLRLRLKANVDISSFSHTNQIILTALKHYGMIVADNGSSWFISGAPDNRWNNDDLHMLVTIPGTDFEAVDESSLQVNANSGQSSGSIQVRATSTQTHTHITGISLAQSSSNASTPQIAESMKKTTKSTQEKNSNLMHTNSSNMLPVAIGSVITLLAIAFAGSLVLQNRRSRKRRS